MVNMVTLIGRIAEINKDDIVIKVMRPYKNDKGIYDTDLIPVKVSTRIMEHINEYVHIDDMVGIKGRIVTDDMRISIEADKVTFLASKQIAEGGE